MVLVGLPGAGKSTVGPLVAARLGPSWRFVDLDTEIERRAGHSVAQIFAAEGEAAFRRLEREETVHVVNERRQARHRGDGAVAGLVLAPGGGWMLDPANLDVLGADVQTVYLRVSAESALHRMSAAAASRPLLATPDPLTALQRLLAARETVYLQANHTVAVELMSPESVADSIVALVSREQAH